MSGGSRGNSRGPEVGGPPGGGRGLTGAASSGGGTSAGGPAGQPQGLGGSLPRRGPGAGSPSAAGFTALWGRRRAAFWREAAPYWRDAGRSGFGTLLVLALLAGLAGYARVLPAIPPGFPYLWLAVPLLTAALASGRPRTFLRPADRVFLLPAEAELTGYFGRSFRYSLAWQAAAVLLAAMALWPLYRHAAGGAVPFLPQAALLVLAKWANLLGSQQESRLVRAEHRRLSMLLRWLLSASTVYALYAHGLLAGSATALVFAAAGAAALRFGQLPRHTVHWEELIRSEESLRARHFLFYSWFADVPQLPTRVSRRAWISGVTALLSFGPGSTHRYLYTKTLVRSELGGMVFRTTVVGLVLLFVFPQTAAQAVVCALVLLMAGAQLSALGQAHRYSPFMELYPGGEEQRHTAVAGLIGAVLAVQTLLLAAAVAATNAAPVLAVPVLLAGGGYAYFFGYLLVKRRYRRRALDF